jgi:N-acetylmuramoyl-L-alanine amidase
VEIRDHRLVPAEFVAATQFGGPLVPELLVMHYTATHAASHAINYFRSPQAKASAHLVVDIDGAITQMVPFNRIAHHAGRSNWRSRSACNQYSVGIEIANPGPLRRKGNAFVDTISSRPWDGGVIEAFHKNGSRDFTHWAEYPSAQLEAVEAVAKAVVAHYSIKEIVGHDDIAPLRKIDPGPAFPLDHTKSVVFGRDDDADDVYQATTTLNVRSGPGTHFGLEPGGPLSPGQRVEALDMNGPWWLIRTPDGALEGWAFGRFLAPA